MSLPASVPCAPKNSPHKNGGCFSSFVLSRSKSSFDSMKTLGSKFVLQIFEVFMFLDQFWIFQGHNSYCLKDWHLTQTSQSQGNIMNQTWTQDVVQMNSTCLLLASEVAGGFFFFISKQIHHQCNKPATLAKKKTKSLISPKIHQLVCFWRTYSEIDGKAGQSLAIFQLKDPTCRDVFQEDAMRVLLIEIPRLVSSTECLMSFFMPFSLSKPREVAGKKATVWK